jgi:hypothetical protein
MYNNKTQTTVTNAIGHILRPLVRILLSRGISFQTFTELAKKAYITVADEDFKLTSKPQTDSRISLLTGINRREVTRIRNEPVAEINLAQHSSMSAQLITVWCGQAEYLDANGKPVPLPRLPVDGEEKSFEQMVQSISKDFRPRVVLDEWLRQGIVTIDDEDKVHLKQDAFVLPQDFEEKLFYFGQNIHDHLAATAHNLSGSNVPFLERCVFYDNLSPESCNELAEYSRTVGMVVLHAFNKRAMELQTRDQGLQHTGYRTNFGIYNFSELENPNDK